MSDNSPSGGGRWDCRGWSDRLSRCLGQPPPPPADNPRPFRQPPDGLLRPAAPAPMEDRRAARCAGRSFVVADSGAGMSGQYQGWQGPSMSSAGSDYPSGGGGGDRVAVTIIRPVLMLGVAIVVTVVLYNMLGDGEKFVDGISKGGR